MKNNNEDAFLQSIKGASPIIKNNKIKKSIPKNKKKVFLKKNSKN